MLNSTRFFNKYFTSSSASTAQFSLQPLRFSPISFARLPKGIDNVHIDVQLGANFVAICQDSIYTLLLERTNTKRRFTDKPSETARRKLSALHDSYADILQITIHRCKQHKQLDLLQLFEVAVIKFIIKQVADKAEQVMQEMKNVLLSSNGQSSATDTYDRTVWMSKNYNRLLQKVTSEVIEQIQRAETGNGQQLKISLLGITWSIPPDMLSNPLLQSPDAHDLEMLMDYYVLLSQDTDSIYGFNRLSEILDTTLDKIAQLFRFDEVSTNDHVTGSAIPSHLDNDLTLTFSWRDVPDNIRLLFDSEHTHQSLTDSQLEPAEKLYLKNCLRLQEKSLQLLIDILNQYHIIPHILAAYETLRLYEHYAHLIKPYLLYQAICGDASIDEVWYKLKLSEKVRPLRRLGDKPLSVNALVETQKNIRKMAKNPPPAVLYRFVKDFCTYRRDLKYRHLLQQAMEQVNFISNPNDLHLSKTNGILHSFFEQAELTDEEDVIKCHVILKADLRGSTTITSELRKRGLNPATHFSRTFFNPIRQLLEEYGAEKVFIEGDAIILSLFDYHNKPASWFSVARACGLARSMLAVVDEQNQFCRQHGLPILELGIGICYAEDAPDFLYDGEQRIMISPAIGDADRLSSCSWKLRQRYGRLNLLTRVLVFQQPETDKFKGEKGMTTFRYNLNGIELDIEGFKKLQTEIALRKFNIQLPGDNYKTTFYAGYYKNMQGQTLDVVVREGWVRLWQEENTDYPLTKQRYYEVLTHKKILQTIQNALQKSPT
ncbi:hypothetical protein [Beggiatoa leptomitoformis]|uniref:Guanylate cyclase domain-containing protein n=1 Tax=Beggiatoa leptomitoformis TaxID=288004 RepID=A0A2N9YG87_9GAMM|nr:hypothetical protein [Beggiatoa leptomitoformis]ALG68284.1 hypothetical protein AL038_11905 [Beggiatoa leptomitoformis]AUI69405.1 hypothetical protein BLE401_12360 [Beggiatoa leptomitoformis]